MTTNQVPNEFAHFFGGECCRVGGEVSVVVVQL